MADQNRKKDAPKSTPQSENARIRQRRAERRAQETAESGSGTSASSGSGTSRTVERRREREQEKKRQRLTTGAIVIGALVLLVVFVIIVINTPADAPIPDYVQARYADIPTGVTERGYPRLGTAVARVQVVEYSSFDCVACKNFHDEAADRIVERVRGGDVSWTFVPRWGTGGVVNGQGAAQAALCAQEQNAFWQMHDVLFHWQGVFGNQAFTNNRILTGVSALGLDRGRFDGCVRGGGAQPVLDTARQDAISAGFTGTPAFVINGVTPVDENGAPILSADGIIAEIDRRLAEFAPSAEATAQPEASPDAEATSELTPEAETTPGAAPAAEAEATPEPTAEATAEATPES